ncbi:MAG: hypothetical protein IJL39_02880 [Clostridia bacterium]|nr:hypothetical protein [Clostridia bacterium]
MEHTCPICGKPMTREGFCDNCYKKVQQRFPDDEWEYLDIEEIRAALDEAQGAPVRPLREVRSVERVHTDALKPEIDVSTCACCKQPIGRKDRLAVELKDGHRVCSNCVSKVRILYPKDYTWQYVYRGSDDIDKNDYEEESLWIDPLRELRSYEFRSSLQDAEKERGLRRERYGNAPAYFRVDNNKRIIHEASRGRIVIKNEYAISGTVLLGEIEAGRRAQVKRRENSYSFEIKRVETPVSDTLSMEKADRIGEGCYGQLVLEMDATCIYPGDILAIH